MTYGLFFFFVFLKEFKKKLYLPLPKNVSRKFLYFKELFWTPLIAFNKNIVHQIVWNTKRFTHHHNLKSNNLANQKLKSGVNDMRTLSKDRTTLQHSPQGFFFLFQQRYVV